MALSVLAPIFLPFRGIRWVGSVVQECQALSRKPGFCFISLLNRSRFLFGCLGHKQPPQASLSFLCVVFHRIHVGWEQAVFGHSVLPDTCSWCRKAWGTDPALSCLKLVLQILMEGLGDICAVVVVGAREEDQWLWILGPCVHIEAI